MYFAIQDIVCRAGTGLTPPQNEETYWVSIVDGSGCSGFTVFTASFASNEGLRHSPNLPLGTSEQMSVRVLRTADNNGGGFAQVNCTFTGTFEKAP